MSRNVRSTPSIEKPDGFRGVLAISPVAPLVADIGKSGDECVLRITNYQTAEIVQQMNLHFIPSILSFSTDGKSLLARRFDDILLFVFGDSTCIYDRFFTGHGEQTTPLQGDTNVPQPIPMTSVLHSTWLDGQNVLVAGTIGKEPCCVVLNAELGSIKSVPLKNSPSFEKFNENHLKNACCSHSGFIAFAVEYGRRILLYQLSEGQNEAVLKSSYHVSGVENFIGLLMDDHKILYHYPSKYSWSSYKSNLVQPRGNSAGGQSMVKYQAKQSEGDFFHALCASKTASYQLLTTGTAAKNGPSHDECPETGQASSNYLGSPQGDQ